MLFTRPYDSRRQWNNHGDIELADPPPADVIPTELVKCCNILHREEQGATIALEALQHRCSDTATRDEIGSIQIALADSLIGQSKYSEADRILQKTYSQRLSLSTHLKTAASLRLNKVIRRLGVFDVSAFADNSALGKALSYASDSKTHMTDECLEELSCTIGFTQQRTTENAAVAETFLDGTTAIVARQPVSTSNWRTRVLHGQLSHESEHRLQGRQLYHHQNLATRSKIEQVLQKDMPLRILLLCVFESQSIKALEYVLNALNAVDSYGGFPTLKMIA